MPRATSARWSPPEYGELLRGRSTRRITSLAKLLSNLRRGQAPAPYSGRGDAAICAPLGSRSRRLQLLLLRPDWHALSPACQLYAITR